MLLLFLKRLQNERLKKATTLEHHPSIFLWEEAMRNSPWMGKKFWLNAGLSLSVTGMPWTATISLLGTSTIATLTAAPVQAAMLSGWEFDPSTQELVVTVPGGTTPRYFLAAEPARIILDL